MITTGQVRVKQSKITKRLTFNSQQELTVVGLITYLRNEYTANKIQYRIKSIEAQMPVDLGAGTEVTAFGRLYEVRAFSVTNRNLVIKPDEMTIYDM